MQILRDVFVRFGSTEYFSDLHFVPSSPKFSPLQHPRPFNSTVSHLLIQTIISFCVAFPNLETLGRRIRIVNKELTSKTRKTAYRSALTSPPLTTSQEKAKNTRDYFAEGFHFWIKPIVESFKWEVRKEECVFVVIASFLPLYTCVTRSNGADFDLLILWD